MRDIYCTKLLVHAGLAGHVYPLHRASNLACKYGYFDQRERDKGAWEHGKLQDCSQVNCLLIIPPCCAVKNLWTG